MRDLQTLFARLAKSRFRARFKLGVRERVYLIDKGLDETLRHARMFIDQRLAAASPANDGKQTPMRGHPVFLAQHATATCCRGCLEKWHGIARGRELSVLEREYVVGVIQAWILAQKPGVECIHQTMPPTLFG